MPSKEKHRHASRGDKKHRRRKVEEVSEEEDEEYEEEEEEEEDEEEEEIERVKQRAKEKARKANQSSGQIKKKRDQDKHMRATKSGDISDISKKGGVSLSGIGNGEDISEEEGRRRSRGSNRSLSRMNSNHSEDIIKQSKK